MKRGFLLLFVIVICSASVAAKETSLMSVGPEWRPPAGEEYMSFNFAGYGKVDVDEPLSDRSPDLPMLHDELRASLDYRSDYFWLFVDWGILNDDKYDEQEPYLAGHYMYMNNCFIDVELEKFHFKTGRGPHRDVVDSPYSIYITSEDIPVFHMEADYRGDFFSYKTRWVNLSYNSRNPYYGSGSLTAPDGVDPADYWPNDYVPYNPEDPSAEPIYWLDKGMNFKVYSLDFGNWRFGLEDVVVYLDRPFDAEYFLSPMPQYFLQLITTEDGAPWSQAGNTKSMMGFFVDIDNEQWGGYSQIMFDDLNLSFLPLIPSRSFKSRVAWSLGGWQQFDFGKLGFHHGGATKYTFSSTRTIESEGNWGDVGYVDVPYSILPYDYSYYPVTEYEMKSGEMMPLQYQENYVGYKYGENNLAFMVDYESELFSGKPYEFKLYSFFEYVINGAKSPANPWHEYDSPRSDDIESADFVLFSGPTQEHMIRVKANARKKLGDFTLMAETLVGYVFNGIKLVDVDPNYENFDTVTWEEPRIYVPQDDNDHAVFQLTLGVNYEWNLK